MPQDKDAREKYETTRKEHKLKEFSKCIGYDDSKVEVKLEDMIVEESYKGPRLDNGFEGINAEWVVETMEWLKNQKVIHKKYASMIILACRDLFEKEKSMVDINISSEAEGKEITVCGDIHG